MATTRTDWQTLRYELRRRSRGFCEAKRSPLCVGVGTMSHHVLRRSQGGKDVLENLLWVCAHCHEEIHSQVARSYELGQLKRSGA